jgi:hypothetical protein
MATAEQVVERNMPSSAKPTKWRRFSPGMLR